MRERTEHATPDEGRNAEAFRLMASRAPLGLFHYDTALVITYCNDGLAHLLLSSRDRLQGLDMAALRDGRVLPALREALAGRDGHYEGPYRATTSDAERWVSLRTTPLQDAEGRVTGGVGIVEDVSERRRAEAALLESERKFRAVFDQTFQFMGVLSPEGILLDANRPALSILHLDEEAVVGRPFWETPWWEHSNLQQGRLRDGIRRAAAGETVRFEVTHQDSGGEARYVDFTLSPVKGEGGRVTLLIAEGHDITDRHHAEEALRDSEASYRGLFNSVADAIYIQGEDGRFLDVNDGAVKIYGYPREFFVGKLPDILSAPGRNNLAQVQTAFAAALAGEPQYFEFWGRRADGSEFPKEVRLYRGTYFGKTVVIALAQDITERKRAEAMLQSLNERLEQRVREEVGKNREKDHILIQQSRLAAMGEMIGNIAHQWRQPINALGILLANIHDAHRYRELDDIRMAEMVETGQRLIKKMSSTIDDFRNFFSPNKEKVPFSLNRVVEETRSILEASLKHHDITLEVAEEEELMVQGYPNECSQVLLNLLNNAKDAFVERGVKNGRIVISARGEGDRAVLSVRDNAGGIPGEALPRVFEPYFTTKAQGSGIGLYMSRTIIENNMGGHIEARNHGDGAEFVVTLPIHSRLHQQTS